MLTLTKHNTVLHVFTGEVNSCRILWQSATT